MKNFIRTWLGLPEDYKAIADDIGMLHNGVQGLGKQMFELFHTLPFTPGILKLTAKDAATFTAATMVQPNTAIALLTGVVMAARQGHSYMPVNGELSDATRKLLEDRGFRVEEFQGTETSSLHIIWS
jgi:hypothetical protein